MNRWKEEATAQKGLKMKVSMDQCDRYIRYIKSVLLPPPTGRKEQYFHHWGYE